MAKQATDAEVMEYLWPTERRVQGGLNDETETTYRRGRSGGLLGSFG